MSIRGLLPGLTPARRRQLGTIIRLELGKNLRSWRGLWLFLLALLPVLPIGLHSLARHAPAQRQSPPATRTPAILAGIFQLYYLRLGIFFGCLGLFMRLFRGEMMERSLHHYLLLPGAPRAADAGQVPGRPDHQRHHASAPRWCWRSR